MSDLLTNNNFVSVVDDDANDIRHSINGLYKAIIADEHYFKEHPFKFLTELKLIWNKMLSSGHSDDNLSIYTLILELIESKRPVLVTRTANLFLQDLYDVLYTDRIVDFSKYEYTDDFQPYKGNSYPLKLELKTPNRTVDLGKKSEDLLILLQKLGLKETVKLIKFMAQELCSDSDLGFIRVFKK